MLCARWMALSYCQTRPCGRKALLWQRRGPGMHFCAGRFLSGCHSPLGTSLSLIRMEGPAYERSICMAYPSLDILILDDCRVAAPACGPPSFQNPSTKAIYSVQCCISAAGSHFHCQRQSFTHEGLGLPKSCCLTIRRLSSPNA